MDLTRSWMQGQCTETLFLHISKEFENEFTNIINSTIKKYDTPRNKFDMYVKNYKTLLKESKPK